MQPVGARKGRDPGARKIQNQASQFVWNGSSHVRTFLRCLRLLDLDAREDWPDLCEEHFSAKHAQQNLQQRVKGVEWSLYRLFELLDPDETKNKLKPFFPPLAHLQSVNLRAALFRALTELKKNAVLGRETILRKTMLDDCRGDKFEEILAKFALIVLRKYGKETIPPANALIVEVRDRCLDQGTLLPLVIAHQKGLKGLLAARAKEERNLTEFEQLLEREAKALKLNNKQPTVRRQSSIEAVRSKAEDAKQRLEQAWTGDEPWADVLVNGGGERCRPNPFQKDFEDVWNSVQSQTTIPMNMTSSKSLLNDLNDRISQQEKRLNDWKALKDRFSCQKPQEEDHSPAGGSEPRKVLFNNHQILQFDSQNIQKPTEPLTTSLNDPCGDLLERMQSSLAALRGEGRDEFVKHESANENETSLSRNAYQTRIGSQSSQGRDEMRYQSRGSKHSSFKESIGPIPRPPRLPLVPKEKSSATSDRQQSQQSKNVLKAVDRDGRELASSQNQGSQPVQPRSIGYSPVRGLSPLAEDKTFQPESSPPDLPPPPQQQPSRRTTIPVSNLIERTRQSMSLLPNHHHDAPRKSISTKQQHGQKATQPRPSQTFPVNQFETPSHALRGRSPWSPGSGSSTPRDTLFSEDADYASVFKSRPRIAMSPNLSPERSGLGADRMSEGEEDDDAALLIEGLEEMDLDSSPSRGSRRP